MLNRSDNGFSVRKISASAKIDKTHYKLSSNSIFNASSGNEQSKAAKASGFVANASMQTLFSRMIGANSSTAHSKGQSRILISCMPVMQN